MDPLVADASVLVKLFLEEPYSDNVRSMRDSYISGAITITVPTLMKYEVMNALIYSKRLGQADINVAMEALDEYDFVTTPLDRALATRMLEISTRYSVTTYDAAYVALALKSGSKLYTADEKLIRAIRSPIVRHIKEFK